MRPAVVVAWLLVSGSAFAAPAVAPVTNGTIVDGDPAVVAILRNDWPYCTGTLIAPRVVLSAGHCVTGGDHYAVSFGADPLTDPLVEVSDVVVHPGFDRDTLTDDVAVFVLAHASDVPPIARAQLGELPAQMGGSAVRLVGFGFASLTDQTTIKREGLSMIEASTDLQLRLLPSPSQPCLGDSGGPVLAMAGDREVLAATVSWGDASCSSYAYATRTDGSDRFVDDTIAAIRPEDDPPDSGGCGTSRGPSAALIALILWGYARASRRRSKSSIEPRCSSTRWT